MYQDGPLRHSAFRHGIRQLTIVADSPTMTDVVDFVLVPLSSRRTSAATLSALSSAGLQWVGWNTEDDSDLTIAAYHAGAHAVFPANMPPNKLLALLQRDNNQGQGEFFAGKPIPVRPQERFLRKGERIHLPRESVIEICAGILAQYAHQYDGEQVLLGLAGPGQLLLAHPQDGCGIEITAHNAARITIQPWQNLRPTLALMSKLAARIQQMEAWSAVQAHPHLDQRIYGLLSLLAESFGVNHQEGTLVDVRLTHAQLASAIGANRTSVTRLLGELKKQHQISVVTVNGEDRFCLMNWAGGVHVSGSGQMPPK